MAKGPLVVTANGGEVDAYTLPRVDMEGAETRAERLENVFIISSGAQELAPGTLHIGSTPGNAPAWLRPWVRAEDLAYHLLLTAGAMRFLFGSGFQTLDGAAATVGAFSDESGVPSGGGGTPPSGGALSVTASPASVTADGNEEATCIVTGGSGIYSYLIERVSGSSLIAPAFPTDATTYFSNPGVGYATLATFRWRVTDSVSGEIGYSNTIGVIAPAGGDLPS